MRNVNKYLKCGSSRNRNRWHRRRSGEHWLRSPDPASRPNDDCHMMITCLIGLLAHRYSIGSQYWIFVWILKSCSIKMLCKMVIFQEGKGRFFFFRFWRPWGYRLLFISAVILHFCTSFSGYIIHICFQNIFTTSKPGLFLIAKTK